MIQEGFYLLVVAQNPNWEMDIRARMQILLWPTTQLAVSPSSRILQSTALSFWLWFWQLNFKSSCCAWKVSGCLNFLTSCFLVFGSFCTKKWKPRMKSHHLTWWLCICNCFGPNYEFDLSLQEEALGTNAVFPSFMFYLIACMLPFGDMKINV